MGSILILDNYDSFTYNLLHSVQKFTSERITIARNDKISLQDIGLFDRIILSPGPGLPKDAGILTDVIKTYTASKKILGVCLGMQAIAEVFGGSLSNLQHVFHGVATPVSVIISEELLFADIPDNFNVGRYHSWVVSKHDLPECLQITCEDSLGNIMALRHTEYNVRGIQFHPESILTEYGDKIISNWLKD